MDEPAITIVRGGAGGGPLVAVVQCMLYEWDLLVGKFPLCLGALAGS
jgi:hypothetical protein